MECQFGTDWPWGGVLSFCGVSYTIKTMTSTCRILYMQWMETPKGFELQEGIEHFLQAVLLKVKESSVIEKHIFIRQQ